MIRLPPSADVVRIRISANVSSIWCKRYKERLHLKVIIKEFIIWAKLTKTTTFNLKIYSGMLSDRCCVSPSGLPVPQHPAPLSGTLLLFLRWRTWLADHKEYAMKWTFRRSLSLAIMWFSRCVQARFFDWFYAQLITYDLNNARWFHLSAICLKFVSVLRLLPYGPWALGYGFKQFYRFI